jgi:CRP-like cAMP-binding protein
MSEMNQLRQHMAILSGMSEEAFALSENFWELRSYKKGEFYNEYKNICKHLAFVVNGVFRVYKYVEDTQVEKNIMFFSPGQLMSSFQSFLTQTSCEYFTESMTESVVFYIHYDKLQELYRNSHEWERFGRRFAETVLNAIMDSVNSMFFRSAEERYAELVQQHPDLVQHLPLYHIASYLGIEGPSLSRIRKKMRENKAL